MWFADKDGWPVETIKGRPIINLLRLLLHTRRIHRGRFAQVVQYAECVGTLPAPKGGRK